MPQHGSTLSPLGLPREEEAALCADPGFQLLRRYLASQADFCPAHAAASTLDRQAWVLHRDVLHALVMPVVELSKRAAGLAAAALCSTRAADLELAFAGEARSAFLCLLCFVDEEGEWCRTRGCPACVTTATLSTESHIRLTVAASLLSTSLPSPPRSPDSPRLPPLPHVLPALRAALARDPFWGPAHWDHIFARAELLSAGLRALVAQCVDLEALVSSPRPPMSARSATLPAYLLPRPAREDKGARIRASQMAKRQIRMQAEELDMLRRCVMQCWARAAVPSRVRGELLGRAEGRRRRSLTCP